MPRPKRSMNDRPDRAHTPVTPGQRAWGRKSFRAAEPPPTADELAARRRRAKRAGACVCDPWPCTPVTGCDPDCRACADRGPLYSYADLRYLEGAEA